MECGQTKVFKRRWYIVLCFSFLGLFQCWVWNTWGPIVNAVISAFPNQWNDSTVAFMANWGLIMFMIGVLPMIFIQEHLGLRSAVILVASFTTSGTILRFLIMLS